MKEIVNRREDVFNEAQPVVIPDVESVIDEAVKRATPGYSLTKTSYTELRNSLGKPAVYYADINLPDGPDGGGVLQYKAGRVYFTPVRYENSVEFFAVTYVKDVQENTGAYVLRIVATSGDTPAGRIPYPIVNFV